MSLCLLLCLILSLSHSLLCLLAYLRFSCLHSPPIFRCKRPSSISSNILAHITSSRVSLPLLSLLLSSFLYRDVQREAHSIAIESVQLTVSAADLSLNNHHTVKLHVSTRSQSEMSTTRKKFIKIDCPSRRRERERDRLEERPRKT